MTGFDAVVRVARLALRLVFGSSPFAAGAPAREPTSLADGS
jgi:hypothetical protein